LKEKSEVLKGLNKQQEKAITFGDGPLLIIAGAGTGKTTVLTRRIVWLIEQGLAKPEEILALTFTEKAATEMEERVDLLMPLGYADINISTFHAFAQKILSQHALDIGLPGDFKVITQTQAWMLIKKNLYDFELDYYKPIGNPNKFIHALLKHFDKAKGEEITPEEYLKYAEGLKLDKDQVEIEDHDRVAEVANAYHRYQKLLLDAGFLDFGDLINYTLKLFRERPKILEFYRKQFKYVLVDEFQDTDLAQYELVRMLAEPPARHASQQVAGVAGRQNNITVVGDDDQSIYKFRGASISNILKFKEDYPDAAEITLTQNYRSTQPVLDLSYNFIQQNNPDRLESKLKISKKLKSNLQQSGQIEVLHAQTVHQEAKLVIDKILKLQAEDGLNFNDFAILVRANDSAEPFISELTRRGISYIFVANRGLYKKPFILDLLAYLRLLDNYHESENLYRVLNFPKFKLSNDQLISFSQIAKRRTLSLYEVLREIHSNPKIDELMRLVAKHTQAAREMPVSELLVRVLNDLGLTKTLLEESVENLENRGLIEKFYRKAQVYEDENDDKTIKGFLNVIKLELEAGDQGELSYNPDVGPETIKVMTIHAAKGLEFSCVFVVNMVDQRFPSRGRREQIEIPEALVKEILPEGDAHLMEERRLFYVAATRAKRFLYLTWADDYGGSAYKKPSRFLVELGLEQSPSKSAPAGQVFFANKQTALLKLKTKLRVPDTFSFSQISCFLHCPLEYKYKYIYHLPLPGEAQLSFGVTIHKTLEKYLQTMIQTNAMDQPDLFGGKTNKLQVPRKDLLKKYYTECWVDDWFADKLQKENYRQLGIKLLDNFYEKFSQNPKLPKFLEKSFKLKLGQYRFVGKIDRGDLNADGTIDIVDYKTGAAREKLSPVDKKQLLIYQWAAANEFKEKVNSLTYWYLNGLEDTIEFLGTNEEIDALKKELLETIEEIVETVKTNNFAIADRKTSHECKYRHFEG